MRSLLTILLIVCPLICVAQEAESPDIPPSDVLGISVREEPDIVQQSDVLRISVWKEPEISRLFTVCPDGFVGLPLVGQIKVAGLTVQQVQTLVVERLHNYIADPRVTVSIQQRGAFLSRLRSIELSTRQWSSPLMRPRYEHRNPCLCETR